eukprot:COSAG05_NODE_915_length_6628_cov_1.974269_4_plen_121_part_00
MWQNQDAVAELARLGMGLDPTMAEHLARCLAERLAMDTTAVKLKSLNLLQTWVSKGSSQFLIAAEELCLGAVEEAQNFVGAVDPVHGTRPTEIVQRNAAKLAPLLRSEAESAKSKVRHPP